MNSCTGVRSDATLLSRVAEHSSRTVGLCLGGYSEFVSLFLFYSPSDAEVSGQLGPRSRLLLGWDFSALRVSGRLQSAGDKGIEYIGRYLPPSTELLNGQYAIPD